jgi:MoxR-like ATPase
MKITPELEHAIQKLSLVRKKLNQYLLERKEETDGILIAILSGTSALFLGDVGTAKTLMVQTASTLVGLRDFDILLSETTKPDQIFGPTDIPALAKGVQQLKYKGYAPDAEILFFDEIFKANATVLNPLLWLMNEHRFRDGDNGIRTAPIKAVFAASNETPTDASLKAVYDRLLLRYNVQYMRDPESMKKLVATLSSPLEEPKAIFSRDEVNLLRKASSQVVVPDDMRDLAIKIRSTIQMTLGIEFSDRRFIQSFKVMQASALLNGRFSIKPLDVELLSHILWSEPDHIKRVQALVYATAGGDTTEISTLLEEAQAIEATIKEGGDLPKKLSVLKSIYDQMKPHASRFGTRARAEVRGIAKSLVDLIDARKDMEVVQLLNDKGRPYWIVQAKAASVFTYKEMRAFGFSYRRKHQYWWTFNTRTIRKHLEVDGIQLKITNKKKVSQQMKEQEE